MHGKLDVSKEQNLWKNENGGSVEMTRVSQDRGISWEEAIASYHAACKAGRPAFFVKVRPMPLPLHPSGIARFADASAHTILFNADKVRSIRVSSGRTVQTVLTMHRYG
jgi:hypothetical protein